MSWSISVPATPVGDFGSVVDAASVGGDVHALGVGLQVTQAKAVLTAVASSGALGDGDVGASVSGHGSPASLSIAVWETLPVEAASVVPSASESTVATPATVTPVDETPAEEATETPVGEPEPVPAEPVGSESVSV